MSLASRGGMPRHGPQFVPQVRVMTDGPFQTPSGLIPQGDSLPAAPRQDQDIVEAEVRSWGHNLRLLVEVNSAVALAADEEAVSGHILDRLREATHLACASVYRLIPEERLLRCVAENGCLMLEANRVLSLDGPGAVPRAARTGEAIYVPAVTRGLTTCPGDATIQSEYAVPLLVGPTVVGVLDIESDQPDGIRAVTRKLIDQVAHQIALALERGNLSRKLHASEERFRSIFEQGHVGVGVAELDGEIVAVNPALAKLVGFEPDELLGRHYTELIRPEDRESSLEGVRQLTESQRPTATVELRLRHKSAEVVWGMTTFLLIRDDSGSPLHLVVMVHDTTRWRQAEAEWARLREQLSHLQKMEAVGALAGGIVHDFNNLLGVIRGYVSLTRLRLRRDDPMQEPIGMIEQSAERAAELARELLLFSRREARKVKRLDLADIVSRVLKIVSQTFDRHIAIETHLTQGLPWIEGDPGELELAILNLCINARDAMPAGGTLTLETSATVLGREDLPRSALSAPGEYVRLVIRDTGVGMDPQVLERAFEPYFTTKEAGQGSGLGLAMVNAVVSQHGGFVRAQSQPGSGSEFSVSFPAATRPGEKSAEPPPAKVERGVGTVLVVDDEPFIRAFAEDALKELGYQVLIVEDGNRACEIFAARFSDVDYVILDMIMPGLDWRETLQKLRSINPHVRVVLSSGYSGGTVARQAVEAGAQEFLAKPYTVEKLASTLNRVRSGGAS